MNKKLLSLLACPVCKKKIVLRRASLQCTHCGKRYPIIRGVPVLVDLTGLPQHLRGQIRYFDKSAKTYGSGEAAAPWQTKYVERLLGNILRRKNKLLIDDACGSGYMSLAAARRGMLVLSCDLNLNGLIALGAYVRRVGLSDRILPVCCSAEALPIRPGCADAIVANAILEHLPKEKEAIADITRTARKGAIAMITVPLAYHLLNPLFLAVNYIQDTQVGHLRRYSEEMVRKRFEGWTVSHVYYSGHTKKVIKTLVNLVAPVFDETQIEKEDDTMSSKRLFASNISVLLRKK